MSLTLLLLSAPAPAESPLRFDSERIRLAIRGDTLRVEGLYRFLGRLGGRRVTLFYPYPADSLLGRAWMESLDIRPGQGESWAPAAFVESKRGEGAGWRLDPPGGERFELLAVYRQLLLDRHARYIVTSTQAWGRPLRHARFELNLPHGAALTRSSYPFTWGEDGLWVYEAENFLPEEDIVVEWSFDPPSEEGGKGLD